MFGNHPQLTDVLGVVEVNNTMTISNLSAQSVQRIAWNVIPMAYPKITVTNTFQISWLSKFPIMVISAFNVCNTNDPFFCNGLDF